LKAKPLIAICVLVLVILGPLIYYGVPWFVTSPDIFYVKAKALQVLHGDIYADPITGYDTFHPPFYHVFLAGLVSAGFSINGALTLVTVCNVALLFLLTFLIVGRVFDSRAAFFTCLMLPFIFEFMGGRNILLATSFNYSLPFYLAGLWLYIAYKESFARVIPAFVLWGIAFLISPVYVFLLILTFVYDIIDRRAIRQSLILIAVFLITIIPFFYQAYTIYSQGLHHTSTFQLWRGIPGLEWWKNLYLDFLSPTLREILSIPVGIYILILAINIAMITESRRVHWFIAVSFPAYLLTAYHFSSQYAIRIEFLLSLILVSVAIDYLRRKKINRYLWIIPVYAIAGISIYYHYENILDDYRRWQQGKDVYQQLGGQFWANMDSYLESGEYIFCTKETYFQFIMTQYPVHSLGAYRTMEYYQLDSIISNQIEEDYVRAMASDDYGVILQIAEKYEINTAVAAQRDLQVPIFQVLSSRWPVAYKDRFFVIFANPRDN